MNENTHYSFNDYHYKLEWSWKEHCYVASVEEFQGLIHKDKYSATFALETLEDKVKDTVSELNLKGEPIPIPYTYADYYAKTQAARVGL